MSEITLGDAPIEDKQRDVMNAVAEGLDKVFNGDGKKETGFVLLVFPYDGHEGRANYISNGADRADVVTLMKEQIARFEGQPELSGSA